MNFGVIGLGVMGSSLSLNIAEKGFSLSVYNRATAGEEHIVSDFLAQNANFKNIQGFTDLKAFVASLERPRKILIMIKAGKAIDHVLQDLIPILDKGDIIIDGGNTHFTDTKRRIDLTAQYGITFLGTGVSGGEEGARRGPSIMPGGTPEGYQKVAPVLEAIAAKDVNGQPCCTYIGGEGAGHFVKMIHNGIEYAEMQLLAEVYSLLKVQFSYDEIANMLHEWNQGELSSYLLEIMVKILQKKEGETYLLDLILDKAGNKGTGAWSSKTAMDYGTTNTMMTEAVYARYISALKKERLEFSQKVNRTAVAASIDLNALKTAYQFARIINHHQGFNLIKTVSDANNWQVNLTELARIWTNGCIIRSHLMQDCIKIFKTASSILAYQTLLNSLHASEASLKVILKDGLEQNTPTPCLSAAWTYWLSLTSARLSANMIQAQRDFFGAHTYQRVDKSWAESFHTDWSVG